MYTNSSMIDPTLFSSSRLTFDLYSARPGDKGRLRQSRLEVPVWLVFTSYVVHCSRRFSYVQSAERIIKGLNDTVTEGNSTDVASTSNLQGLTPLWLFLHIAGGQIGLPLAVFTNILLSRSTGKNLTLINFCVTWIIYSVVYCLLCGVRKISLLLVAHML